MFEKRSQQSKTEVDARTERSQNSSHEQTCCLLKKIEPVEYRKRLELLCVIISNLTSPKSEHQNRQEKKNTSSPTNHIKVF